MKLTAERLIDNLSDAEKQRALLVESALKEVRSKAEWADREANFPRSHLRLFKQLGLTGLIVPKEFGGLGGSLRDLTAATFALGSACPSTALTFFFHCSTASRGLLALEAMDQGLFEEHEIPEVREFAQKVLYRMGQEGLWFSNFGSESVKSEKAAVTVATTAKPVDGGFILNGVKSFGCGTGVSDFYLVTAMMEGNPSLDGIGTFFIPRETEGVRDRVPWNAIGMRGTATHGIILENVFVPKGEALVVPGAFTRMMKVSRGSFVGNQVAGTACYLGAAHHVYDEALANIQQKKFADTGRSIGEAPFLQQIIGDMDRHLITATLWMRRQLELEHSVPPPLPKGDVVRHWRHCKGEVSEACFQVAALALKCGGTSGTGMDGFAARGLRDMAMGLVQAFPPERGRMEAAKMLLSDGEQALFGGRS